MQPFLANTAQRSHLPAAAPSIRAAGLPKRQQELENLFDEKKGDIIGITE